jgi:hypothetical protein
MRERRIVLALRLQLRDAETSMPEVLRTFDEPVVLDGIPYRAQVCARPHGHLWEGWIEFAARDGSDVRRTPRETTQPDRDAIVYWSQGLSGTYLEGALARTTTKVKVAVRDLPEPYFDAPDTAIAVDPEPADVTAILDPFSVGDKGEEMLRRQLGALRDWHLRNIVRAYELADPSLDLEALTAPELIDLIVAAVEPA